MKQSTRAGTTIAIARIDPKYRARAVVGHLKSALLAVMLVATSLVLTPYSAEAQVDTTCGDVTVTASGGATALDGAIVATNACPGPQTITLESGTRVEISGGGAGIDVSGEVTLADSYIWNNTGAGFKQGTRTTSIITNTVFGRDPDGNAGPNGIGVTAFGEMRMSSSVVANSVNQGIEVYPGYLAPATGTITDATIYNNRSSGLRAAGTTVTTTSGTSLSSNNPNCEIMASAILIDAGANSDDDGTCGTNHSPIAADEAYRIDEDESLDVPAAGVLANDSDEDDYAGADTFVYRASDGTFGGEATATIALRPVNDAPTLDLDETATVTLGQATSTGSPAGGPLVTEPPVTGPLTTGPLAYTGLRSVAVLQLALMMIGAGCALAAVARRRRVARSDI